jgi:hypothetical protein
MFITSNDGSKVQCSRVHTGDVCSLPAAFCLLPFAFRISALLSPRALSSYILHLASALWHLSITIHRPSTFFSVFFSFFATIFLVHSSYVY